MYSETELEHILTRLLSLSSENEVVEFKEAKTNFDFRKLGKYFSALSNEVNLRNKDDGWLVFGVKDDHTVVGTVFRSNSSDLHNLKKEIADRTTHRHTFREIYEINFQGNRVVMFNIPPAPKGIPIPFDEHHYARDHEALVGLSIDKIEQIRSQVEYDDWSAQIIPDASIVDLEPEAIKRARVEFLKKFPDQEGYSRKWDDATFLNKAKITRNGKITRAAIVLLGRAESEHFLSPSECKIRWVLRNKEGDQKDYALFACPLILAVDLVFQKVRNLRYRYLRDNESLFPEEVDQYDPYIIREAINNCIAHQDYTMGGRINVIEFEEGKVKFTNKGQFIPDSVESVVIKDAPEEKYRNPFLATAMYNVNMVDTAGGGIRRMFQTQADKFFPLPEYDLSDQRVELTIVGQVLDMDYASILIKNRELSLQEIMMLDKVQKGKRLTDEEITYLRRKKLIEGRKPNLFLSREVAQTTGQGAKYVRKKGFDKETYLDMVQKFIKESGALSRAELDEILFPLLPSDLDGNQKKNKVMNLLSELRRKGIIENVFFRDGHKWVLVT